MKRVQLLLLALLFMAIAVWAQEEPFPYEYPRLGYFPNIAREEQGFRLGHIIKLNAEGFPFWRYRWEGQLMMGFGTDQGSVLDNACYQSTLEELRRQRPPITRDQATLVAERDCYIGVNPWPFSFFDDSLAQRYSGFEFSAVVVFYQRPTIAPQSVVTNTKNYVRRIWPVNPSLPLPKSASISWGDLPISIRFTPVEGSMDGRVIAAYVDNVVRKTFQIVVQLGPEGSNYRFLSLNSGEVFDYIVRAMFTGQMLRIDFVQLIAFQRPLSKLRGYQTPYYITRVTAIGEAPGVSVPTTRDEPTD